MNQNEVIIAVDSLEKSYKDFKVLKGISFTVPKGSIFALLGSNGAGKTTTVSLLSTLLSPTKGSITICGFDTVRQAHKVREHISLTGQYAAVDELLTGRENLLMISALRHLSGKTQKTNELLEAFQLLDAADRRVSTYSGGMRRSLDPQSRLSMWKMVKSFADSGITIFLTTQYIEEAEQLADNIAILHNGTIVDEGTPEELKEKLSLPTLEDVFLKLTGDNKEDCHGTKM